MKWRARPFLWAGIAAWGLAGVAIAQSTSPSGGTGDPGSGTTGGGAPVVTPPVDFPPVYYTSTSGVVETIGPTSVTVRTDTTPPASVEVQVNQDTTIIRQENVDIDQLKAGDHLSVNGRPKGIVADSLESGDNVYVPPPVQLPAPATPDGSNPGSTAGSPDGSNTSGGSTAGGSTAGGTTGGAAPNPAPVPPGVIYPLTPIKGYVSASAYATGVVASVDTTSRIILLTLNDGSSLPIDVPAGVLVHRSRPIGLSDIKVGEKILASGYTPASDAGDPGKVGPIVPPVVEPVVPPIVDPGGPIQPAPTPEPAPTGPFTATYIQVGDIGDFVAVPIAVVGVGTSGPGSTAPSPGTTAPAPGTTVTTDNTGSGGTTEGDTKGAGSVASPGAPVAAPGTTAGNGQAALPHTVRGSLTGQGPVNVADATLALRIAVGLSSPTPSQLAAGDLFGQGHITMKDVTLILQAAVFGLTL